MSLRGGSAGGRPPTSGADCRSSIKSSSSTITSSPEEGPDLVARAPVVEEWMRASLSTGIAVSMPFSGLNLLVTAADNASSLGGGVFGLAGGSEDCEREDFLESDTVVQAFLPSL